MPYKDERGIWRHDKPLLTGAEIVTPPAHRFVRRVSKHVLCPNCGGYMDMGILDDTDETDSDLADEWGVYEIESVPQQWKAEALFTYVVDSAECDDCGSFLNLGREWYYNPTTNNYDLPRPLTRAEAALAENEVQQKLAEAAGQLPLFAGYVVNGGRRS